MDRRAREINCEVSQLLDVIDELRDAAERIVLKEAKAIKKQVKLSKEPYLKFIQKNYWKFYLNSLIQNVSF